MSGKLTKTIRIEHTPGSPAVPATPGSPYVPAYYTTEWRWRKVTSVHGYGKPFYIDTDFLNSFPPNQRAGVVIGWSKRPDRFTAFPPKYQVHTNYPAVPAVAPTAGRPGTAAQLTQDFNTGWNSGAISRTALSGDCEFVLAPSPSAVGIVAGLNSLNEGTGYLEIDHGLYFSRGKATVYESGEAKTAGRDFAGGDEFTVQRLGRTVSYLHNTTPIYTSLADSEGAVFADTSMYTGGDTILSAAFSPPNIPGGGNTSLLALGGTASDKPVARSSATFSALEGVAYNFARGTSAASLRPMAGASSDKPMASSQASFEPLGALSGAGGLAPAYALSAGSLAYLLSAGRGLTGEVASSAGGFGPVQGGSSDKPYASATGAFESLTTYDFPIFRPEPGDYAELDAVLPAIRFSSAGRDRSANLDVVLPAIGLDAGGHGSAGENALAGVMPRFALRALGGASTVLPLPSVAFDAQATSTGWGTVATTLPVLALGASGIVAGTASAELTIHDTLRFTGHSGAVCAITIGGFTAGANGLSGAAGKAAAALPLLEVAANGAAQNYGDAAVSLPALQMGATARAQLALPGLTLTAIGTAVVVVSYEAYSVNLSHTPRRGVDPTDEVTHYTSFPFTHIVRYQGDYFGVAADGLYLLDGTTDDGAAIPYAVKTCVDDFKMSELKTVASAYFGGRLGPDATVTLHAGEQGQESYPYSTPRGQGAQNHREKFGRGVKNRYFAIGVAGDGALGLDTIELEVNKMSRRI